jgi:hypothetical protein
MIDIKDIQPGDCLLYRPNGIFGWLIALKTWNRISHVEIYAGNGHAFASRDGKGVNLYPFRKAQLAKVLRPTIPLDLSTGCHWFFNGAQGQKYDWKGILVFTLAAAQGAKDKMFCSEFATRFYRMCKFPIFGNYDADHIAPAQFLMTSQLTEIWSAGEH